MSASSYRISIILLITLFFSVLSSAQQLPELPVDKTILSGTLPNNTKYYIVANPASKNMADFALIQKSSKIESKDSLHTDGRVSLSRRNPRTGLSPLRFFEENDIIPGTNDFLETREDGTVIFRFNEVMPISDEALLDSALLVLMNVQEELALADTASDFDREFAVIISGDINPQTVSGKLKMMSYMVPFIPQPETTKYEWKSVESSYKTSDVEDKIGSLSITWRMPRTPEDEIKTILPVVHDCLMGELGVIAVERVKESLEMASIPYADVSWKHISSFMTASDEMIEMSLKVADAYIVQAVQVVAEALSSISRSGISTFEFAHARRSYVRSLGNVSKHITNQDNINRCISAFLNGTNPISPRERLKYHQSKSIQDSVGTQIIRRAANAAMTIDQNCQVECTSSSKISPDSLKNVFLQAWNSPQSEDRQYVSHVSDTLLSYELLTKTPVRSTRKEPVSGGSIWTFANNMKVIYRRMDTAGKVYWSFGLEGGYGSIKDLSAGEGAFIEDMLKLSRISGMKWGDFILFLESQGIELQVKVGLTKTILSGTATYDNLSLLFRALAAIANEREIDEDAFKTYLKNEWHRLEYAYRGSGNRTVIVDSLMCPDYKYSKIKKKGVLNPDLQRKAESFFESRFSMMNDGVLVLVGNKDESLVRKELRRYVHVFRTKEGFYPRPLISFQPTGGAMTHTEEGLSNRIYMAMSVQMPLNRENVMVSEVAATIMRRKLSASLAGTGASATLFYDTRITPHERFNIFVVVEDASASSLEIVRRLFSEKSVMTITDSEVDSYKPWLIHKKTLQMEDPKYWTSAILLRYLEGKDFTTGYKEEVNNITGEKVRNLLSSLVSSSKVEYIIKKK